MITRVQVDILERMMTVSSFFNGQTLLGFKDSDRVVV